MRTSTVKKSKAGPKYRTANGRRVVLLEVSEYERLRRKADEWEPLLPESNADGNYPALEALQVSIARSIIRHPRRLGLTQVELAKRARIRPETLNRIEQGKVSPSVASIEKIDRALKKAEGENAE